MTQDLFRLDGKTAFVSGSRGHLGAAMTRALCAAGAHVIVNGRDAAALDGFAADLKAQGFSVEAAAFDAHDVPTLHSFFGGLKRLDVLVNNVGLMLGKSFAALTAADFAATYAATVTSAFESARAALPALRAAVAACAPVGSNPVPAAPASSLASVRLSILHPHMIFPATTDFSLPGILAQIS